MRDSLIMKSTINPLVLVALLALLFGAATSSTSNEITKETLSQVCSPKASTTYFSSPQKVKNLLALYASNRELCDESYRDSFEALEKLLNDDEASSDICSLKAYNQIRHFHQRFISVYTPEASRQELERAKGNKDGRLKPIPESLRHFFVLFALQMNAACKRQLVARLEREVGGKRLLQDKDFEVLDRFKFERHRLFGYQYHEQVSKFKDLKIVRGDSEIDDSARLYVEVRFGDNIKMVKDACANKFQPIYDELFTPVIMLNNLGYMDRSNTKAEDQKLAEEERFRRWYDIIQVCELFRHMEVIQDSSASAAVSDLIQAASLLHQTSNDSKQQQQVKILTKEEAQELKEKIEAKLSEESEASVYRANAIRFDHQPVAFTPRMWVLEDAERAAEVRKFEARLKRWIKRETNLFSLMRRSTTGWIRKTFYKRRLQFKNKDEQSAVGRLAAFLERHKAAVQVVAILLTIMIVSVHFVG